MRLYHGTSFLNLINITRDGFLIPQKVRAGGVEKEGQNEHFLNRLFFTDDIDLALKYSKIASGYEYGDDESFVVISVEIDLENLLPDNCDCVDVVDWKESLNESNQVSYVGELSKSHFRKVLFLTTSGEVEMDTGFDNWKQEWNGFLRDGIRNLS